jgi:hypothetical protein
MITLVFILISVILMIWAWIWGRINYGNGYVQGRTDQLESMLKAGWLK